MSHLVRYQFSGITEYCGIANEIRYRYTAGFIVIIPRISLFSSILQQIIFRWIYIVHLECSAMDARARYISCQNYPVLFYSFESFHILNILKQSLLSQSLTVKFAYDYLENKVVLSTCSPEVKLVRIPSLQSHIS